MSRRQGTLRIGTSGYHYDHWAGVFYPSDLSKGKWFSHYASTFDTVEINNTFYHLPKATTFEAWRRQAPEGFCYALKFSRYGSHIVRLKKPCATIGRFLKRADRLEKFLGPILVQLPPNWKADPERLAGFLKVAPTDHRWAVEFRDPRWLCEAVFAILNEHRCALCIHDMMDGEYSVFDYGCGKGNDVRELEAHGLDVTFWDPVYHPDRAKRPRTLSI